MAKTYIKFSILISFLLTCCPPENGRQSFDRISLSSIDSNGRRLRPSRDFVTNEVTDWSPRLPTEYVRQNSLASLCGRSGSESDDRGLTTNERTLTNGIFNSSSAIFNQMAYEYAKCLPNNDETVAQWEIIRDPNRNSLIGFLERWKSEDRLNRTFSENAKKLISQHLSTGK